MGIACPIVPGIMPITTYNGFNRMTTMCKTFVPESVRTNLEAVREDDEKVKAFGVQLAVSMCAELIASPLVDSVHIYTMNNEENIREIVRQLSPLLPAVHNKWLPLAAQ